MATVRYSVGVLVRKTFLPRVTGPAGEYISFNVSVPGIVTVVAVVGLFTTIDKYINDLF